ncbi:hypothetical protein LR48_Vigan293s000800 [Vigna angularis]|uniref:Uncharacterized protein n=1 Tax=Phaseolus angularis TaxID=3914 RepID=A0A0L9T7K1_PHAAN|nr:hypothetical protein LR48_Vigan293s000800 [Vigna angularis]
MAKHLQLTIRVRGGILHVVAVRVETERREERNEEGIGELWIRNPNHFSALDVVEKRPHHPVLHVVLLLQPPNSWATVASPPRVFYNNLKIVNGDIQSRVKGVNIYIDNNLLQQVARLKVEGEEDLVYSSGSTPVVNEDHTNFFPETNFERFVVDQFRNLNERVTKLERKIENARQQRRDEPSDKDSMDSSESE